MKVQELITMLEDAVEAQIISGDDDVRVRNGAGDFDFLDGIEVGPKDIYLHTCVADADPKATVVTPFSK